MGADDNRGREQSLPSEEQSRKDVGDTPCTDLQRHPAEPGWRAR